MSSNSTVCWVHNSLSLTCKHDLCNCKPTQSPVLTMEHQQLCFSFTYNYAPCWERDLSACLFTDESRFSPTGPDGHVHVWRCHGQWYAQSYVVQRYNFFGGSIIVWGGISCDVRTIIFLTRAPRALRCIRIKSALLNYAMPYMPLDLIELEILEKNRIWGARTCHSSSSGAAEGWEL